MFTIEPKALQGRGFGFGVSEKPIQVQQDGELPRKKAFNFTFMADEAHVKALYDYGDKSFPQTVEKGLPHILPRQRYNVTMLVYKNKAQISVDGEIRCRVWTDRKHEFPEAGHIMFVKSISAPNEPPKTLIQNMKVTIL